GVDRGDRAARRVRACVARGPAEVRATSDDRRVRQPDPPDVPHVVAAEQPGGSRLIRHLVRPSRTAVRLRLKVSPASRWAPSMTSRAMVGYLPVASMRVR